MQDKRLLLRWLGHWRILRFNRRIAVSYLPLAIILASLFSLLFLSPNPALQNELFGSIHSLTGFFVVQGALIFLAAFAAVLAFYKKNNFFLVITAWVLCNLYLGGRMLGMDSFWLQKQLPAYSIGYISQLVVGAYFLLSQQLLQISINLSSHSSRLNKALGGLVFVVFILAFIPYAPLFNASLHITIPLALGLALALVIDQLHPLRQKPLNFWHVMLLTTLSFALFAYALSLFTSTTTIHPHFNAFIFLVLANITISFGIADRMKELRLSHDELRSNYQNSPFAIIKINHEGKILRSNRAFRQLCSKLKQPVPTQWNTLFTEQRWSDIVKRTQASKHTEINLQSSQLFPSKTPLLALYANVIPGGYVLTLQDITLYMNTLNQLKGMINNDPITQTLNQRGLEKGLDHVLANLTQHQPCFLAYLDVNRVGYVNRIHGHSAGEVLLQEVSLRINEVLKSNYTFGRIDSDDFVFLLDKTNAKQAQKIGEIITERLNSSIIKTGYRQYKLNVYLGMIGVGHEMSTEVALRTAQQACMEARLTNTPLVIHHLGSKAMQERAEEQQLFEQFEAGITDDILIAVQPLMNLLNPLATFKVEILLRIRRKNGELIPLHSFIPAAEENGTIRIIDKAVFTKTLEWLCTNLSDLEKINRVNINLSGYSLNDDDFIEELFVLLDQYQPVLHKLCVEITEGVALEDLQRTRSFMIRLQKRGIYTALDDFGAGYTSFSYLRELPANIIKIDGALIQDMLSKESNIAIVRTLVELTRNLGVECVAEWVEDLETLKELQKMGVNYAQGFVISKARSKEDILAAKDIRDLIQDEGVLSFIASMQTDIIKQKLALMH